MRVSCLSLLQSIDKQRLKAHRKEMFRCILMKWCCLFCPFLILMLFQCHNRIYNAWKGPFSMNTQQFQTYLDKNYNLFGFKSYFSFHCFFFQPEYIQIELGENCINHYHDSSFQHTYRQEPYGRVTYTYNQVIQPTITTRYKRLYLKFGSYEHSKYDVHHLYNFQSLNINTLRCIVKHLEVSPVEISTWYEKSMYMTKIENLYRQNSQIFTTTFMSKCGVIVGTFYKPKNVNEFPGIVYGTRHALDDDVRLFDSSYYYTPYFSYLFVALFIYFVLKNLLHIKQFFTTILTPLSSSNQNLLAMQQLNKTDIISLEDLDNLLMETTYQNNYHDCLFILREKYLLMFLVNFDENSPNILEKFYENVPFLLIPLHTIKDVQNYWIIVDHEYISFPFFMNNCYSSSAKWLHGRLMFLNEEYRVCFEQKRALQQQQQEQQRHLNFLIYLETEYQQRIYEHDIGRIWERITSASPEFIAQFRLTGPQIATKEMLLENCSICLENFQSNRFYRQWPCPGRHQFHFDCMLDALRTANTCPLCRHPVEPANLFRVGTIISRLLQRTMATVLT
ncbi:hypothetical protein I4U23_011057 [Adineta vaga]|nr:hypothetical protein I4U23_011057 [Adineta vaga]